MSRKFNYLLKRWMEIQRTTNTLATHILHLPPRRAANIMKRLTETVFEESQSIKCVVCSVGDTGGERMEIKRW